MLRRWARRAVSFPLLAISLIALCALAPLLAAVLSIADLARGARFAGVRGLLLLIWLLGCEVAGLLGALGLWLRDLARSPRGGETFLRANAALQSWWNGLLFSGAARLFALRVECEGGEALSRGPILLLVRHASTGDALLPLLFGGPRGLAFRFVLKRGLLWDPCLDVVGQRLPNAFVRRGSDPQGDLATLRSLATGLGPRDAVVLFPEGTRFSPARRAALLETLERKGDRPALERARSLRRVLPPRSGGALALLEAAPDTDVVFCAHRGLEGMRSVRDFGSGALVGAILRVRFWRVPRAQVPDDRDQRLAWLHAEWTKVDAFAEA